MATAEPQTRLATPAPADMPSEVWGLFDTELQRWLAPATENQYGEPKLMFFTRDDAGEYWEQWCGLDAVKPRLIWRRKAVW